MAIDRCAYKNTTRTRRAMPHPMQEASSYIYSITDSYPGPIIEPDIQQDNGEMYFDLTKK